MKNRIKSLYLAVALFAVAVPLAEAATHQSMSFLNPNIATLVVSNTGGTIIIPGATNLLTYSAAVTNAPNTLWTNKSGVRVLTGSGGAADYMNVFADVPLWPSPTALTYPAAAQQTNTLGNITIKLVGVNAALDAAVSFVFSQVPDGVIESTAAADDITISVTGTGTTPVVSVTPLPSSKYSGVKALRLKSIYSADTTANSQANITAVEVNGFVP